MCTLWTKHHVLYFLAGAAAFHALSHFMLYYINLLPLTVWGFTLTNTSNAVIIVLSLALSAGLIYYACAMPCVPCVGPEKKG